MINKKAQEEMVGFVLIMVVVAIVFLIFLGIFINKDRNQDRADSNEISQFLDSALEYHIEDCSPPNSFRSLKDLILECSKNDVDTCEDSSETFCDAAKSNFKELIESGWKFSTTSPEVGYLWDVKRSDGTTLINLPAGGTTSNRVRASEKLLPVSDGTLSVRLEIRLKRDAL